jgi:hypothetical protein
LETLLRADASLALGRDECGATALHYSALNGHRRAATVLIDHGADINSRDGRFKATPAGWAIEHLRERGGLLGMEIDDLAYAVRNGDARWAARFLARLSALRTERDADGRPIAEIARDCGHADVAALFAAEDPA